MDKGKYYITTAIAYTSGTPHIGNSYEIVLADSIARFKRKDGYDVYFQTGTDEHGQKIELKAQEAGITPKEFVDGVAGKIRSICDSLNTSYDKFVRTTDGYHEKQVQKIFKKLYEQGDISYLQLFTESLDVSDMLNKAEYVEKVYEYDRKLLTEYQETVEQVAALQDKLEEEKSELQTSQYELEDEEAYLEEVLAQKKEEYENYTVMLAQAKQQAAAYTTKIKQETAQIKQLEEEERKRREEEERKRKEEEERRKAEQDQLLAQQGQDGTGQSAPATNTGNSSNSSQEKPSSSSSGSAKGQEIANFACQYVGNPYVAGGTSLTNGADCSGFVMSVYKNFGYSLPRSSYAQSGVGKSVSYAEAQPGDIIYYGGHVAIYIGNGRIVHASTERTGIKTESATYRSIITIRRII